MKKKSNSSVKKPKFNVLFKISNFISVIILKLKFVFRWLLKNKIKVIISIVSLWIILSVVDFLKNEPCYIRILPGERGVVFNNFSGGIQDNVLGEGMHFIFSGLQVAYRANVSRQSALIERITADSKEFQDVALWINVEFQLQEENLSHFFRIYGVKPSSDIKHDIIIPNANEVTKNIIVTYSIGDVLTNQKEIKNKIKNGLTMVLEEYYISVIDIDIVNIKLDEEFRNIIAQTEFSDYEKEKQLKMLEAAEIDSQRRLLNAETLKAEKILEAEAVREYNRLISERAFDPTLLEYMRIENYKTAIDKWDGRLPTQMDTASGLPFLNESQQNNQNQRY